MPSLDIKIAGEEPAVPQILKIDAIWVVAVQVATETLESSAEKAGFCISCCNLHFQVFGRQRFSLNPINTGVVRLTVAIEFPGA